MRMPQATWWWWWWGGGSTRVGDGQSTLIASRSAFPKPLCLLEAAQQRLQQAPRPAEIHLDGERQARIVHNAVAPDLLHPHCFGTKELRQYRRVHTPDLPNPALLRVENKNRIAVVLVPGLGYEFDRLTLLGRPGSTGAAAHAGHPKEP